MNQVDYEVLSKFTDYDKEDLGTSKMLSNPNVAEGAFDSHVFGIREVSFGAQNGFSGGCGCK